MLNFTRRALLSVVSVFSGLSTAHFSSHFFPRWQQLLTISSLVFSLARTGHRFSRESLKLVSTMSCEEIKYDFALGTFRRRNQGRCPVTKKFWKFHWKCNDPKSRVLFIGFSRNFLQMVNSYKLIKNNMLLYAPLAWFVDPWEF